MAGYVIAYAFLWLASLAYPRQYGQKINAPAPNRPREFFKATALTGIVRATALPHDYDYAYGRKRSHKPCYSHAAPPLFQ